MRQNLLLFLFMVLFFGFSQAQGTISGVVFEDDNANGTRDIGEPGRNNVVVTLYDNNTGTITAGPSNTNFSGNFSFPGLAPGDYYVRYNPAPANPNYVVSPQDVTGANTQATDVDDDSDPDVAAPHNGHVITITSNEVDANSSMGIFLPANINGEVWLDNNGDGLDAGDGPTPIGINVSLLDQATLTLVATDANGNALTNPVTTTSTYTFADVAPGDYVIEFSEPGGPYPGGLHITKQDQAGAPNSEVGDAANDSDPDVVSGRTFDFTLSPNETINNIDAGYIIPGQVGDFVWEDLNGNGIQDGGEPGLGGIQVELQFASGAPALDPDGNAIPAQVTGGAGDYVFDEVPPGTYKVAFEVNPGGNFYFTLKDVGGDNTDSDADRVTGETVTFTIQSGDAAIDDIDAGYYQKCTIGDFTWHDLNGNGLQDGGEPDIAVSISITDIATGSAPTLQVNGTTAYTSPITSGATYIFDELPPGTYKLTFTAPANYYITQQNAGSGTDDSDPDPMTGMTVNITCNSGDVIEDIDAGFYTKCVISDFTWEDLDGDGLQGAEPGLGGVGIEIIDVATGAPVTNRIDGGPYISNITSSGGGAYIFDLLPPGEYKLNFTKPGATYYFTQNDAGSDDLDSDADVMTGMTVNITCNSDETIENVDAGFFEAADINGKAWHDSDGDGLLGAGEPPLDGVTFTLVNTAGPTLDATGNPVGPVVSAGGGIYTFLKLRPGTYTMTANLGGWIFTLPNVGDTDSPDGYNDNDFDAGGNLITDFTLLSGQSSDTRYAGLYKNLTIGGSIWGENDGNSTLDAGETGGNGVIVGLYDAMGVLIATTTGDVNGNYQFTDVPPGDYKIVVEGSNFVSGGPLYGLISCAGQGTDDQTDNDDNGTGGGPVESVVLPFYCGQEFGPEGLENLTIDFCFTYDCGAVNPLSKPTCSEITDTLCDLYLLATFCSRMPTDISVGSVPSPLCNGQGAPHNMSWFAFVAGSGSYSLIVEPFACAGGQNGAQLGIYTDCTFTESVYCQANPCVTGPQVIPSSLFTPGNTYFFWMDGCSASVCSYTINIEGDFQQYQIPAIVGIDCSSPFGRCDTICPNNSVTFTPQAGYDELSAKFYWKVTSPSGGVTNYVNDEYEFTHTFTQLGTYAIELTAIDVKCSLPIPPYTTYVTVANPADENFGVWPVCEFILAVGWEPATIYDTNISDPNGDGIVGWQTSPMNMEGTFTRNVTASNGCVFNQTVEIVEIFNSPKILIDTFLCPGEGIEVGPYNIDNEVFPALNLSFPNSIGCDSIVDVIVLFLGVEGALEDVGCTGNGYQIKFNQGPNPFIPPPYNSQFFSYQYIWTDDNGNVITDGDPDMDPKSINVTASGTYFLSVVQSFDNSTCNFDMGSITIDLNGLAPQQVTQGNTWDNQFCEDNTIYTYTMTSSADPSDIIKYIWTYPVGATVIGPNNAETITIDWNGITTGQICASVQTDCGISVPLCETITVVPFPVATLPALPDICQDSVVSISASGTTLPSYVYNWNFNGGNVSLPPTGPGPHLVSWGSPGIKNIDLTIVDQSCASNPVSTQVEVIAPVPPPQVDCAGSLGQVQFTWPTPAGATSFDVTVTNGPVGILNGNTYTVTVPGNAIVRVDILLTTNTNSPCGNLISLSGCESQDCIPPAVDIEAVNDICLTAATAPIQLKTIITPSSAGTSLFTGNGIIDQVLGIFDPKQAMLGPNVITLNYEDPNGCKKSTTETINVFETPTANFTTDQAVICQDSTLLVDYTGNIATGGTFDWTFGANVVTPGNGRGPFDLQWSQPGQKQITLVVTKNGCVSGQEKIDVKVDPRIEPVSIECTDQQATEVTVGWNGVTNINNYTLKINGTPTTLNSNITNYNLTGLTPNDHIFFELVTNSNNECPGTIDTVTCIAELCPTIVITFNVNDTTICLNSSAKPFTIDALVTGGLGTGTGVRKWKGTGVDANGVFDPVLAGPSSGTGHKITMDFTEGTCKESESIFIKVLPQPSSAFTIQDTICVEDELSITYTGTPGQTLQWQTPAGITITQVNSTKYKTSFPAAGNYKLGLINGTAICLSELTERSVRVEPSLDLVEIKCASTLNSVNFSWDDIDCASKYLVTVDGVDKGSLSALNYLSSNLQEGQKVVIEVTPVSECACPAQKVSKECEAKACPPVVLTLSTPKDKFCEDDVTTGFQLVANVAGSVGTGSGVWSGQGVNAQGVFNPQGLTAGVYKLKYAFNEENCDFDKTIDITIYDNPFVTVTTSSPDCYLDNFGVVNPTTIGGDGNYNYRLDGNGIQLSALEKVSPGAHLLVVNDGNNCDASSNFTIGAATEPPISISGQSTIIKGQSTSLTTTYGPITGNVDSIVWSNSSGVVPCTSALCKTINISPIVSDKYCVKVYYNGGCYIESCFDQKVEPLIEIILPNIISTGSGSNGSFFIQSYTNIDIVKSMSVYDRWGNLVYTKSNFKPNPGVEDGWNGRINNKDVVPGVYVYTIDLVKTDGKDLKINGDVTVVK